MNFESGIIPTEPLWTLPSAIAAKPHIRFVNALVAPTTGTHLLTYSCRSIMSIFDYIAEINLDISNCTIDIIYSSTLITQSSRKAKISIWVQNTFKYRFNFLPEVSI